MWIDKRVHKTRELKSLDASYIFRAENLIDLSRVAKIKFRVGVSKDRLQQEGVPVLLFETCLDLKASFWRKT